MKKKEYRIVAQSIKDTLDEMITQLVIDITHTLKQADPKFKYSEKMFTRIICGDD